MTSKISKCIEILTTAYQLGRNLKYRVKTEKVGKNGTQKRFFKIMFYILMLYIHRYFISCYIKRFKSSETSELSIVIIGYLFFTTVSKITS